MANILPPAPVGTPFGSYAWADWYRKVRDEIIRNGFSFDRITNLPTNLAGYGITDAVEATSTGLKVLVALPSNPGSQTATMTNSPVLGNPTKWVPILDNGVVRYLPLWG